VDDYLPLVFTFALAVVFILGSIVTTKFVAPRRPTAAKAAPYESGIVPTREPPTRFPVRFYLVAMAFIVLDVEIIFLYPFTTIFRDLGGYGLALMGVFLLVLIVPFAYLLSVGALDWGPARQVASRIVRPILRTTSVPSGIPAADEVEEEAA